MKGKPQISIGVSETQVNVQPAERKLDRLDQLKRQHGSTHSTETCENGLPLEEVDKEIQPVFMKINV